MARIHSAGDKNIFYLECDLMNKKAENGRKKDIDFFP